MESTPVFVKTLKGGLVLRATPAALSVPKPLPGARAKAAEKVEAEARAHVISQGGDPSTDLLVLSQHRMQFGKYWGQTFKWLLENDVGYTLPLVHSHQQERERSSSQSALMANKDALTRYSHAFPEFVEELRFHKACDAARVRASQPGREGEALVGFGQYKWELLRDLYDSKDKERLGFVKWLRRKTPQPGTQMDAAIKYIRMRDQEAAAGVAGPTSTPVTPAPDPILPPPSPPVSSPMKGHLTAMVSQYLGQQRPLTPQALQAKVMKVIKPSLKPAASGANSLPRTSVSEDDGEPPHPPLPPPPPPPPPSETVPRTTAWRKRKKEEAAGDTDQPQKARKIFTCQKCGLPKRKDTGHSRFGSSSFCSVASGGKSVEVWLAEQRDAKGRGDDGH